LAKKVANEKGVDLSQISGSGPNGRILRNDVEEQGQKVQQQKTEVKTEQKEEKKEDKKAAPKPQVVQATNPYVDEPVTNIRDVIARRLLESKTTIPHYYLESEISMDKISK
jgi:pyruvate dehydrogenase E2 component (dihydrolipoamide acetyltransferase)